MQKILAISKFLATLFMLFMLWVAYSLISLAYQSYDNENLDYIPHDADFVLRIDAQKLIKSSSRSIILNEDEEAVALIREVFEQDGETEAKPLGVAVNSDVIVFTHQYKSHTLTGVLLNLTNVELFKKNIPAVFGKQYTVAVNGNVGLLYFEIQERNRLSKSEVRKNATKLLSEKSDFDLSLLGEEGENVVAQSWSSRGLFKNVNMANNTKLSFIVTDKELLINGELAYNNLSSTTLKKELVPDGLHFSSNQITGALNNRLHGLFETFELPKGKVNGISVNYHELELIDDPVYFPAPKFDALLSFSSPYSIKEVIDTLLTQKGVERIDSKSISFKGLTLYYDQIDPNTVLIGSSSDVKIMGHDDSVSTWVYGTPSSITKVSGSRMLTGAISMMPFFKPSQKLFEYVDHIGIRLGTSENGISKAHAVLQFKDGEHALNALVKFALQAR